MAELVDAIRSTVNLSVVDCRLYSISDMVDVICRFESCRAHLNLTKENTMIDIKSEALCTYCEQLNDTKREGCEGD